MNRQDHFYLKFIISLILLLSLNANSQLVTECQEDFHGVGEADIECDESILITSTPAEGQEGTVISGLIYSQVSVKFIAGYSKVRFIPVEENNEENSQNREGNKSKAGNGGKKSVRYVDIDISEKESVLIYPNPVHSNLTIIIYDSKLIRFELISTDSRLLIRKHIDSRSEASIDLTAIKSGLHFLKLYLENGKTVHKQIVKS